MGSDYDEETVAREEVAELERGCFFLVLILAIVVIGAAFIAWRWLS